MTKQIKIPLYEALMEHLSKNPVSFHVPGHKYGCIFPQGADIFQQLLKIDATELSGLDDLHSPEGVILEAESLLAELFRVKKSFFLVNGSTVGNLAMIMAVCTEESYVLVQRNCHKSVLNALKMANVRPIFLEPEYDSEWKVASGVSLETVKEAIQLYPEAKAIILTYPNYYGMVYDLQGVIQHAHQHRIPVLVDEAHGAHFIASTIFPSSAVQMGADIVVQSAHKTLPAMTMGSFLHVNSDLVNINRLTDYLQMLQSSSPSYPIMASLDLARSYLAAYGENDIQYLFSKINQFKEEMAEISAIKVLEYPNSQGDLLKVTIQSTCGLSGFELQRKLEGVGIYTELADPDNVLLIMPLLKENQSYPFRDTVNKMKTELAGQAIQSAKEELPVTDQKISELAIPYKEMVQYKEKHVNIADAINLVCAETVIPYPPGIPLLLRGERITIEKTKYLKELLQVGGRFQGGASLEQGLLKVFLED